MSTARKCVSSRLVPAARGAYSQAIVSEPFVFISGQRPAHPETGILPPDIRSQTRQCIENVANILLSAGSSLSHLVNVRIYLSDIDDFAAMNEVYSEMVPAPYPTRTTIEAGLRGMMVEIECIARIAEKTQQ